MFVKQSEALWEFSNAFGNLRDDVSKLVSSSLEQAVANIFHGAGTLKDYNSNGSVYEPWLISRCFVTTSNAARSEAVNLILATTRAEMKVFARV